MVEAGTAADQGTADDGSRDCHDGGRADTGPDAAITRTFLSFGSLVIWSMLGFTYLRGRVQVERAGITVPRLGRRTRRLTWDEVESIAEPGRCETVTTLLLADGSDVALEGVPQDQAPAVAEPGGKPVRNRPVNRFR